MSRLKIRCLGGLEVRDGDDVVVGFESRKVRALLAYLVCQPDRGFTRDHLSGLFWPDRGADAARRNLRQALYNIKTVVSAALSDEPLILAVQDRVQLAPGVDRWLDVEAFDEAIEQGTRDGGANSHHLAGAVRLYQGDFLSDILLKDDTPFDDWLAAERQRLRERMVTALRFLVEGYLRRGETRLGIQYAQRLVSLDTLSEEAHRYLIRLYAQSGRRSQALDQYAGLVSLLERELGVEPLEETQQLYDTILHDDGPKAQRATTTEPIGPLIPLVQRAEDLTALGRSWDRVRREGSRLALIEGEPGIGKTRLARSFLDTASARHPVVVLIGNCIEGALVGYQPWPKLLRSVLEDPMISDEVMDASAERLLIDLAHLVPEIREHRPELPAASEAVSQARLFQAVHDFLGVLIRAPGDAPPGRPVIVFLDDVDWAEEETLALLVHQLERLADLPVWFLVTCSAAEVADRWATRAPAAQLDRLTLDRLDDGAVREVATWLVGPDEGSRLAAYLNERGQGLPMGIAETVNLLCDRGVLLAEEDGKWRFEAESSRVAEGIDGLDDVIGARLQNLPASTRRLATLAAVIGQEFRPELIGLAGEEHSAVVDIGLELMIERWLMRRFADRWTSRARARDIVLWEQGARQGRFEFAHKRTRRAIYGLVHVSRRRIMHRQIAHAFETLYAEARDEVAEQLAVHLTAAGDHERAIPYLLKAVERARAIEAPGTAAHWESQCRDVLAELVARSEDPAERDRWAAIARELG